MSHPAVGADGRLVVGVDGSASSIAALRWAGRLAGALGLRVDAITVWNYAARQRAYVVVSGGDFPHDDASRTLTDAVDAAFGAARPHDLRLLVHPGHSPAKVLLEAARDAELLALGSRGHGGVAGVLLGSVSAACAEHATCPVLVVHGEDADLSARAGTRRSRPRRQ